jgi:hypothetical protein
VYLLHLVKDAIERGDDRGIAVREYSREGLIDPLLFKFRGFYQEMIRVKKHKPREEGVNTLHE